MEKTMNSGGAVPEFRLISILIPLISIIAGVFMVVLDGTAMNVALSHLQKDFNVQMPTIQWAVTGYMLAQASVIPLAGWLSDRYGAKTIFLISTFLFTAGSILCATPSSAEWLIFFRVIQGLGGGSVLPVSMAYVYRLSPPHKVGAVMGMMGIPILFAPAIGPVLAGWLVEYHSWRWIFLINIPVGILAIAIGWFKLPKVEKHAAGELDKWGIVLGPLAFAALSYGVSEGASSWTSAKTIGGLLIGGAALIAFIITELLVKRPLLELRVFKSVDFVLGILVQWIAQFALFGAIFLLPQFLQQARGYGAFDTGLILLPQALASGLIMPIGGLLFDKIGVRWLVVAGLSLVSGAIFQYSHVDMTTTGKDLLLPLIMAGSGMGLMMMPLNTHLINKTPRNLVSRVTSLTNAMQQVVNSLAVAGLVTILSHRFTTRMADLKAAAGGAGQGAASGGAASSGAADAAALKPLLAEVGIKAFNDTFHIMIFIAIIGALFGLVLRRDKKQPAAAGTGNQEEAAQAGFMHG